MLAAKCGHGAIVEYLHKAGADINNRNKYGWTPLNKAAGEGYGDIVQYLHQAGADINIRDNYG